MKTPTKTEAKAVEAKAIDALVAIAGIVLETRGEEKPTLSAVARIADRAAGLLKLGDDKQAIANAATIAIAKKYALVG